MGGAAARLGEAVVEDCDGLLRDGCVVLRGAIPAGWIEPLQAIFEATYLPSNAWPAPRGVDWRHAQLDTEPLVQQVCALPAVVDAVHRLLGEPFFLAQVEGRDPCPGGGAQALHRDADGGSPPRTVSVLAFLDPFGPQNGATQIALGTHRGAHPGSPAPRPETLGPDQPPCVLEGAAGDVLVFDANLLHGATRNIGGAPRRSLLISYSVLSLHADHLRTKVLRGVRMIDEPRFDLGAPPA